jgi:iron complex outermembrane receptor protein
LVPLPERDPGLALTANAAYVDAKYSEFPNCPGFQRGSGFYSGTLQCTGNDIVRTPRISGGIGLVQSVDVGNGTLEMSVDGYFNSGFYYDAYNTVRENAYEIMNGHVSYLYTPWNTRVTFYGKNLLDARYHDQQFQTDFGITKTLAPPLEFGIRLNWNFQ